MRADSSPGSSARPRSHWIPRHLIGWGCTSRNPGGTNQHLGFPRESPARKLLPHPTQGSAACVTPHPHGQALALLAHGAQGVLLPPAAGEEGTGTGRVKPNAILAAAGVAGESPGGRHASGRGPRTGAAGGLFWAGRQPRGPKLGVPASCFRLRFTRGIPGSHWPITRLGHNPPPAGGAGRGLAAHAGHRSLSPVPRLGA